MRWNEQVEDWKQSCRIRRTGIVIDSRTLGDDPLAQAEMALASRPGPAGPGRRAVAVAGGTVRHGRGALWNWSCCCCWVAPQEARVMLDDDGHEGQQAQAWRLMCSLWRHRRISKRRLRLPRLRMAAGLRAAALGDYDLADAALDEICDALSLRPKRRPTTRLRRARPPCRGRGGRRAGSAAAGPLADRAEPAPRTGLQQALPGGRTGRSARGARDAGPGARGAGRRPSPIGGERRPFPIREGCGGRLPRPAVRARPT